MTINFTKTLPQALENIEHDVHHQIFVHDGVRDLNNSCAVIEKYGQAKWQVVDLVNERFNSDFDLHNWLNKNKDDELAYFLNEAGSNCLNYSEHKVPYQFHLWLGKKGFVVGIEQLGKCFDAQHVQEHKIKGNEGAAFEFFRNCQSEVFFDDAQKVRIVLMEVLFTIDNL